MVNKNKFLSVSEIAQMMGLSRTHVLRKIKSGEIPAYKVGKSFVIKEEDLPGIYHPLTHVEKAQVRMAVEKTMKEFGEVIRKLGST